MSIFDLFNKKELENYEFCFSLTDENIRREIVDFISPIKNDTDIINLQFAYGVLEKKTNTFVTRIKSANAKDDDTGQTYYTTYFVALVKGKCFGCSYISQSLHDEGELVFDVPQKYNKILVQALNYWRNYDEHKVFEKEFNEKNQEITLLRLNSELRKPLYDFMEKQEIIKKKHFDIKTLDDAKTLFYMCDTDCHKKMKENYDEATVATFNKFVDSKQKKKWIVEECEEILAKITAGDTTKLYKKLATISGKCEHWLSDPDDLSKSYTKACRYLYSLDVIIPLGCIESYLKKYTVRFNPLNITELIDITEDYLKKKYAKQFETGKYTDDIKSLMGTCTKIRGMIKELLPIDNPYNFSFVKMPESMLDYIVEWFKNKYNDMEAVKETLVELNCVYGLQNDEMFLVAASDAADNLNNQIWDRYSFIIVMLNDKKVIEFRCKLYDKSGDYEVDYRSDKLPENWKDAVRFYRNVASREAFFEYYAKNISDEKMYIIKPAAHEAFFKRLGSSYQVLWDRIGDNPLKDTLKKFVELCEHIAPEYGFNNIWVGQSATKEEIEQWEKENDIKLPKSYCDFLMFANGFRFLCSDEHISGLNEIIVTSEYIEPDYMLIGSIIGDGTTLCISKSTGKAYIEDHGDYRCYEDFKDLFEYVIELIFRR